MLAYRCDSTSKLPLTNRWHIGTTANAADLLRCELVSRLAAHHQWYHRPYHRPFSANNTQNWCACVRSNYKRIPPLLKRTILRSLSAMFWYSRTVAFVLLGDKVMRPHIHTHTHSTGNLAMLDQHNELDVLMTNTAKYMASARMRVSTYRTLHANVYQHRRQRKHEDGHKERW